MSTTIPTTSEFLLLFRDTSWHVGLSPEQMQSAMNQFMAWFETLAEQGKLKAGQPLEQEGKVISGRGGSVVVDGPFSESKEAIGGYFLLQVDDFDAAVAIAQQCPTLQFGAKIEVRPVAAECPTMRALRDKKEAEAVAV